MERHRIAILVRDGVLAMELGIVHRVFGEARDEQGRALAIRAERYLGGGADAKLTPWTVPCSEWRVIHGVQVPTRGGVVWKLPSGDFDYYRWEILDIEYNRAELY